MLIMPPMITSPPSPFEKEAETDRGLLSAFAEHGDESAFARLVRRHAGLVYHAALRRTADAGLAEEVTQSAFALLAKKAPALTGHPHLPGWLHRTATWLAGDAADREAVHRRRMKAYADSTSLHAAGEDPLAAALPHLDGALLSLRDADRRLIFLRFHEGLSFQAIGDRLRQPHDTARKATNRAVARLGATLRRSGVLLTTAVLTSALSGLLTAPAPAALLAGLPSASLTAAGSLMSPTLLLHTLHTMTALQQIAAAAAIVALCAVPVLAIQEVRHRLHPAASVSSGAEQPSAPESDSGKPEANPSANVPAPPVDVLALIRAVPSARDPFRAAALAAGSIGSLEPSRLAECVELAHSFPNEMLAAYLLMPLYQRWAEVDPDAAMRAALASRKGEFAVAVHTVGSAWMKRDPAAAVAWLKASDPTIQRRFFQEAGEATRAVDSAAMAEIIRGWPPGHQEMWARTYHEGDGIHTMELALRMDPGPVRERLLSTSTNSFSGDPAPLLEWCQARLEGSERSQALTNVLFAWSRRQPDEAIEWYLRQPRGTASVRALAGAAKLADDSFYAEFRQRIPEEDRADLDLHRVMMMEGAQAAERIPGLPESAGRTRLYETAARNWADKQPLEASVWVDSLPPGPERDSAIKGLTAMVRRTDVSSALTWAEDIQDEKLRARTITDIWKGWRARDGVAAKRWLREAEISPDTRAVIESTNTAGVE